MARTVRTVGELGETGLLRRIARAAGAGRGPGVRVGIGDDAALLTELGPEAVLTADMLIEDVDFRLAWASWEDVGCKAAAANLSDLAAMGARPRGLLLSLGLRAADRVGDALALVRGVARVGARYGAPLVGGDVSATAGPLVVAITAVGEVGEGLGLRRGRGRVGDLIGVTGELGGAAAGLALLEGGGRARRAGGPPGRPGPRLGAQAGFQGRAARGRVAAGWIARQLRPTPRVALGRALAAERLVRSAADISDGLARDVLHVAGEGLGVELDLSAVPLAPGLPRDEAGLRLALAGGEDFELVLAIAPGRARRVEAVCRQDGVPIVFCGQVSRKRGLHLHGGQAGGLGLARLSGFEHFGRHVGRR